MSRWRHYNAKLGACAECKDTCGLFICSYRFGNCVPFKIRQRGTPCDDLYTPGVDHVYISNQRSDGNFDQYLYFVEESRIVFDVIPERCIDPAQRVLCHFFLPPCGNSTFFEPPTSVCMEACNYLAEICPFQWEQVVAYFEENDYRLRPDGLTFINCSNTGEFLDPLPYCCSDVGVEIRRFSEVRVLYAKSDIYW